MFYLRGRGDVSVYVCRFVLYARRHWYQQRQKEEYVRLIIETRQRDIAFFFLFLSTASLLHWHPSIMAAAVPRRGGGGGSNSIVKFNVGGTKYEVSRSLLDRYPHSMLAKICSDTWHDTAAKGFADDDHDDNNNNNSNESEDEIFVDRNGERFQYVLDYLRDAHVELPRSIPRGQFLADLGYYGLDYTEESVSLSLASPRELIYSIERHEEYFDNKSAEIERRYRNIAAERMACDTERQYFKLLVSKGRDFWTAHGTIEPISEPPIMMDAAVPPTAKRQRTSGDQQQQQPHQQRNSFHRHHGIVEVTVKCPLSHAGELNTQDLQEFLSPVGLKVEHVKYRPSYRISDPSNGDALVGLSIL